MVWWAPSLYLSQQLECCQHCSLSLKLRTPGHFLQCAMYTESQTTRHQFSQCHQKSSIIAHCTLHSIKYVCDFWWCCESWCRVVRAQRGQLQIPIQGSFDLIEREPIACQSSLGSHWYQCSRSDAEILLSSTQLPLWWWGTLIPIEYFHFLLKNMCRWWVVNWANSKKFAKPFLWLPPHRWPGWENWAACSWFP